MAVCRVLACSIWASGWPSSFLHSLLGESAVASVGGAGVASSPSVMLGSEGRSNTMLEARVSSMEGKNVWTQDWSSMACAITQSIDAIIHHYYVYARTHTHKCPTHLL